MSDAVAHLLSGLTATPLFGLAVTLGTYLLAVAVYRRLHGNPWANPVLWSVVMVIALLLVLDVPYPQYFSSAQFIHFLLGPAVVALAWPLWVRRQMLMHNIRALMVAAVVGLATGCGLAVLLGWALGLPQDILRSIVAKALTAPVAMGIAESIAGVPALAAVSVLLTGLIGAIGSYYVFKVVGTPSQAAQGFALGAQSHGIGTALALHNHPEAGAYAGLAMGIQALLGALLIPLLAALF